MAVVVTGLCTLLAVVEATAQEPSTAVELRVRLWAGEGGAALPIPGADVWLRRTGTETEGAVTLRAIEAKEPGTYHARVPSAGTFDLHVGSMGFAPVMRRVYVGRDGTRLDVHLFPAPVPLEELVTRIEADHHMERRGHTTYSVKPGEHAPPSTTLADWLATLPGLEVRQRGEGGPQHVTMRGSRPEAVLVLLDGIPLNDPLTGAADLSGIPIHSLESATVVLGSDPIHGPGASAGVVSLRSPSAPGGTSAALTAGSFGRVGLDLSTGSSGRLGAIGVGARIRRSENDFMFQNRVAPSQPQEKRRNADRRDINLTIGGQLQGVPVRAAGRLDAVERGSPGRMGTRLFDEARWEEMTARLTLSTENEAGSGLSAGYAHRFQRYTDRRIDREESLTARQIRLQGRWSPDSPSPWRVAGFLANEAVSGEPLHQPRGRWMAGLTASTAFGPRVLEISPSLSFDVADGDAALSPTLALGSRIAERWRAWARAGQAYRIPTFADLYLASSYQVRPNPDLRPERVDLDAEIGVKWASRAMSARASGFVRRTRDPIVWLPSSTAVWSPRNAGRLTAFGAEAELGVSPLPSWEVGVTGTWTRSRVRFDVDRAALPYQPEWSGALSIERVSGPRSALVRLRYTGARPTSIAATHELPANALVDVAGRQRVRMGGAELEIELGIRNLLGARYELVELFPEPGRQLTVRVGIRTRPRPGLPSERQAGNMHLDDPSAETGRRPSDPVVPTAPEDGDRSHLPLSRGGGRCTER